MSCCLCVLLPQWLVPSLTGCVLIECGHRNMSKSNFTAISNLSGHTWSVCWQQTDIDCDHWCLLISFLRGKEIVYRFDFFAGICLVQSIEFESSHWQGEITHNCRVKVTLCVCMCVCVCVCVCTYWHLYDWIKCPPQCPPPTQHSPPKEIDLWVIKNVCVWMLANFMFYSCRLIHICRCQWGLKGICLFH